MYLWLNVAFKNSIATLPACTSGQNNRLLGPPQTRVKKQETRNKTV